MTVLDPKTVRLAVGAGGGLALSVRSDRAVVFDLTAASWASTTVVPVSDGVASTEIPADAFGAIGDVHEDVLVGISVHGEPDRVAAGEWRIDIARNDDGQPVVTHVARRRTRKPRKG